MAAGSGHLHQVDDFNWEGYEKGEWKPREPKVKLEHVRELFENGNLCLEKADAAKRLQGIAKVGRTAAYDALKLDGRFSEVLRLGDEGRLGVV